MCLFDKNESLCTILKQYWYLIDPIFSEQFYILLIKGTCKFALPSLNLNGRTNNLDISQVGCPYFLFFKTGHIKIFCLKHFSMTSVFPEAWCSFFMFLLKKFSKDDVK